MELRELTSLQQLSDPELEAVAAQIKPLPENVVPSDRFLEQMRRRLLQLSTNRGPAAKAA